MADPTRPGRTHRTHRLRHALIVIGVMLAVAAGAIGFGYWDQYRYDSKVPLGTWYGTFTSSAGTSGAALVEVVRRPLNSNAADQRYMGASNSAYFTGSARLCFPGAAEQRFTLHGFTDNTGSGFSFDFVRVSGPAAGLRFSDGLHGERRQESLVMSGQLAPFAAPGQGVPATAVAQPTSVSLARGDAQRYVEACRTLGAPAG